MNLKQYLYKALKSDNNKQLLNNISGALIVKGFSLIIYLFTMPAYMFYFHDQQILGVWFTLLSILTWVLMFDLGIGNGLRNNLVAALVEKDDIKAKQYISSAYIMIGIVSFGIIIIGSYIIYLLDWNSILNIKATVISNDILTEAVVLAFTGIMLQFFLKLVLSILNAMQETAVANLIILSSSVLILLYVIFFKTANDEKNLLNLSIIYIFSVNLPLIITSIVLFSGKLRHIAPNVKNYVSVYAMNIIKLGGQFFWVQVTFMIITSTNEILIASFFGPENVVEYQIYYKLFYTIVTLFSLISNPIWSAVTKAHNENRIIWIKKIYKLLNFTAVLASMVCFALIFVLQPIIDIWLGANRIQVNYQTAIIFAIFCSVMMYILSVSSIANGIGELIPQLIGNTTAAILKIPLSFLLSLIYGNWVVVILVNIIILLPYAIWQPFMIKKTINRVV